MPIRDDSNEGQGGFTLIEGLGAMIVLGTGIAQLLGALGMQAKTSFANHSQSQAESVLGAAAEYVKGLPYDDSTVGGANCGGGTTPVTTQVDHDAAFGVTYGPATPPSAQNPPLNTFGSTDST